MSRGTAGKRLLASVALAEVARDIGYRRADA